MVVEYLFYNISIIDYFKCNSSIFNIYYTQTLLGKTVYFIKKLRKIKIFEKIALEKCRLRQLL